MKILTDRHHDESKELIARYDEAIAKLEAGPAADCLSHFKEERRKVDVAVRLYEEWKKAPPPPVSSLSALPGMLTHWRVYIGITQAEIGRRIAQMDEEPRLNGLPENMINAWETDDFQGAVFRIVAQYIEALGLRLDQIVQR